MWPPLLIDNTTTIIGFLVLLLLHVIFVSRSRLLVDMIAVYSALVVLWVCSTYVPFLSTLFTSYPVGRAAGSFFGVVGVFHVLLWRSNFHDPSTQFRPFLFVTSMVYRVAIVGLFISSFISLLPVTMRGDLTGLVAWLFGSSVGLVCWMLIPFVFAFTYRFHAKNGWIS